MAIGDDLIRELEGLRRSAVLLYQQQCVACGDAPRLGCEHCGGAGYFTPDGIYSADIRNTVLTAVISLAQELLPETGHIELRRIINWGKRYGDETFLHHIAEVSATPAQLADALEENSLRTGVPLHPFFCHVVETFRHAPPDANPRELLRALQDDGEEA